MPRLKDTYKADIIPAMMQKFEYKNINQVPKLEKVVINLGLGEAKDNPKVLDSAVEDLTVISGQKPVVTTAKKSVANFKLREGMKIGAKVDAIRGMDIIVVTTAETDEEARELLTQMGMPFAH